MLPIFSACWGVLLYNGTVTRRQRQPRPPRGAAPTSRQPRAPDTPWDRAASWYDSLVGEKGSEYHQQVVIPGTLRLLALQKGERVLDLGCGQGVLCRALYKEGAQVTGVDLSRRLVQVARQRSPKEIRYLVADARKLDMLDSESFDAITCVLAAQNMNPLEPVFQECARLLRPGGRLVLVVTHPAFRIPRQSHWGWDEDRKLLYRAVDLYLSPLKIPIDVRPFKAPGRALTWTYHRPLQDYVNTLAAAGLWTNALEEWPSHKVSQPGPMAEAENRARSEFPMFLALRAVKIPWSSLAADAGDAPTQGAAPGPRAEGPGRRPTARPGWSPSSGGGKARPAR